MKIGLSFILVLYLLSCTKEPFEPINPYLNCKADLDHPRFLSNCDKLAASNDKLSCEIIHVGDYDLEDTSKQYVPQYCENIGNKLIYQDNKGNELIFEVTNKFHIRTTSSPFSSIKCANDSSKVIAHCINIEYINITLSSITGKLTFEIKLSTKLTAIKPFGTQYGDVLEIAREIDINHNRIDFYSIISQRTLSFNKYDREEFYSSLTIGRKIYKNVISNNISNWPYPSFKFFYNKDFGLIAFKEINGTMWSLKL